MNLHFSYGFCVDGLSAVFEEKDCSKHQADNHQRDQNHPPNEYRVVDLENWKNSSIRNVTYVSVFLNKNNI